MRRVFHHLLALLVVTAGLWLAALGGANAHAPTHAPDMPVPVEMTTGDQHEACTLADCRSDAEVCCHLAAGGCSAFVAGDAPAAIGSADRLPALGLPRRTPPLVGCLTPVEPRPPTALS